MGRKNVALLAIAFVLLFAGFDSSQQYFSAIFYTENIEFVSFLSLSLLYLTFGIANLFAPGLIRRIGLKRSLLLSSFFYPLFILSIVFKSEAAIYVASVILGVGAALLWTAHGTYVIKITEERNRGFYSGLLFSLLPLGTVLMLFGSSFFVESIGASLLYFLLFLVSVAGALLLLFIDKAGNIEEKRRHIGEVFGKRNMLLLIPFIFSASFTFALMISTIPIRITDLFGLAYVGKIASLFMLAIVATSITIGKLSDKYGMKKFVFLSSISGIFGFGILISSASLAIFSLGIVLISFNYASFLALGYPVVAKFFKKELDSAMAIRWFVSSMAIFIAIISATALGFFELASIQIALLIIALVSTKTLFSEKNTRQGMQAALAELN